MGGGFWTWGGAGGWVGWGWGCGFAHYFCVCNQCFALNELKERRQAHGSNVAGGFLNRSRAFWRGQCNSLGTNNPKPMSTILSLGPTASFLLTHHSVIGIRSYESIGVLLLHFGTWIPLASVSSFIGAMLFLQKMDGQAYPCCKFFPATVSTGGIHLGKGSSG